MNTRMILGAMSLLMFSLFGCTEEAEKYDSKDDANAVESQEDYHNAVVESETWFNEQTTVVAPWAKMLGPEDTSTVTVLPDRLTFAKKTKNLQRLLPGDILISADQVNDRIFLRRVVSAKEVNGFLEVMTSEASISDVVLKGELTAMPTQETPARFKQNNQFQGQNFDVSGVIDGFKKLSTKVDNLGGQEGVSGTLSLNVSGPSLELTRVGPSLKASLNKGWTDVVKDVANKIIPGKSLEEKLCSHAVNIQTLIENNAHSERCYEVYEDYLYADNPINTIRELTSRPSGTVRSGLSLKNGVRVQCKRDSEDTWDMMPNLEELEFFKKTCTGSLKEFDLNMEFGPEFSLSDVGAELTIEGEANLSPVQLENEEGDVLIKKTKYFTFWIGWFPVILSAKAKVVANIYKATIAGSVKAGVKDLTIGQTNKFRLLYLGGEVASFDNWAFTPEINFRFGGSPYLEGKIEGSLEHEIVGLKLELLLYEAVGPFIDPASIFMNMTAGLKGSTQGTNSRCFIGMNSGIKGRAGLLGQVPFTSKRVEWNFMTYNTCDVDGFDPLDRSYYDMPNNFCFKKCIADDGPEPIMNIAVTWDDKADIDLEVVTPDNDIISFRKPTYDFAVLNNPKGCKERSCNYDGPYSEDVNWLEAPQKGSYRVRAYNRSEKEVRATFNVSGRAADAKTNAFRLPADTKSRATELFTFEVK